MRTGIVRERLSARNVLEAVRAGKFYLWDWADVPPLANAIRRIQLDEEIAAGATLKPHKRPGCFTVERPIPKNDGTDGYLVTQEILNADPNYIHVFETYDPDGNDGRRS